MPGQGNARLLAYSKAGGSWNRAGQSHLPESGAEEPGPYKVSCRGAVSAPKGRWQVKYDYPMAQGVGD